MKHCMKWLMLGIVCASAHARAEGSVAEYDDASPLPAQREARLAEFEVADASTYPYGVSNTAAAPYSAPAAQSFEHQDYFRPSPDELLSPALAGQEIQPAEAVQDIPLQPEPMQDAQAELFPQDAPPTEIPAVEVQAEAQAGPPGEPGAPGLPGPAGPAGPAAPAGPWSPTVLPNFIEVGMNYYDLTKGQGDWFGQYGRAEIQTDLYNRWSFDLLHQKAFDDSGVFASIGNTHTFDEYWYSDVSVGAGTDVFFLPQLRVDAFLNRKWLEDKSFITTVGVGYYGAHETYNDASLFLGSSWYFMPRWMFGNGVRFNVSAPGGVFSPSAFVALTEGAQGEHFVTLRYGFGREAYQLIGPGNALSEFTSNTLSLDWRQWLGEDWGFHLRAEHYGNPNYDRNGFNLGVFKEF